MSAFERSALLLGDAALKKLETSHVAVFGLGGVGSYAVEALARAGVGALTLVDSDTVAESNLNRQLIATQSTIGRPKAQVAKERVLSIVPTAHVEAKEMFYLPENADELPLSAFDYIIDAVDTMSAKIELVVRAQQAGVPIVSAMGCGNRLDPTRFCVTDVYKTNTDPLARVLRRELRRSGVTHLKVVCSQEPAQPLRGTAPTPPQGCRQTPGSVSFVPGVAGLILAGEAVKDLVAGEHCQRTK